MDLGSKLCLSLLLVTIIIIGLTSGSHSSNQPRLTRRTGMSPSLSHHQRALLMASKKKSQQAQAQSQSQSQQSPYVLAPAYKSVPAPEPPPQAAAPSPKYVHQHQPEGSSSTSKSKALLEVTQALARSHSASEVLTLNLTNLLILIVLKAIIFGIGLFYFGGVSFKGGYTTHETHGGYGKARTLGQGHGGAGGHDGSHPFLSQDETLLMLTFLLGSATDDYECMNRVACEDPSQAKSYMKVSKLLMKGAKWAENYISYHPKYEKVIFGLEEALEYRKQGGDCSARYICKDIPHL